ncbi:MAG: hypothetical protein ACFCD0_22515 [Gemmataceae bacterium]
MKKLGMYAMMFLITASWGMQDTNAVQRKKANRLMEDKLRFAKMLLEAVAKDDYKTIAKTSQQLIGLSQKAEWRVRATARYKLHSDAFREAALNLKNQALKEKSNGVAFAYVELTLTCLRCHQTVRAVKMTSFTK